MVHQQRDDVMLCRRGKLGDAGRESREVGGRRPRWTPHVSRQSLRKA